GGPPKAPGGLWSPGPLGGGRYLGDDPPDDRFGSRVGEDFNSHPDAEIVRSQPGLGAVLGARVLGEFGDDPNRYVDRNARRNYAGTSPVTRASGKKRAVLARLE